MYPQSKIQETPILLDIFPEYTQIQHITVGRSHALALTSRGKVYQFDNPEEDASLVTFDGKHHSSLNSETLDFSTTRGFMDR
ncbi:hypothetical protein L0F63_005385 [Massospora cicadina]|nr:hypothetical protein L0F63_005385 [Massospora cicadina]